MHIFSSNQTSNFLQRILHMIEGFLILLFLYHLACNEMVVSHLKIESKKRGTSLSQEAAKWKKP